MGYAVTNQPYKLAKGGIALVVSQQLGLPIRFIGAGEDIEDLRPFFRYEFVEALLNG